MSEDEEVQNQAYEFTSQAGHLLAEATGFEGVEPLVDLAAHAGVAVGTAIEHATNASEYISDGLTSLVGEEQSKAAADDFSDGNYLSGVGHMAEGAGETIIEGIGSLFD